NAQLLGAVAELERRGVLRPASGRPGAYDFSHDLIRQAAYRRLADPRRRLVHRQIQRALEQLPDPDDAIAADLAHHASLAGDAEAAARACLRAGGRCLRIFAHQEAAALAMRGLGLVERLPLPDCLELEAGLLLLLVHAGGDRGRERRVEADITRVARAAEGAGASDATRLALQALSYLHWRDGDAATAAAHSLRAAEAGRAGDPFTMAHALADTARCLAHLERDLHRAELLVAEAQAIAEPLDIELLDVPWALALLRHFGGDTDAAADLFRTTLALARAERHRWAECDCLTRLAMIDIECGRPDDALRTCAELVSVASRMGEGSEAPFARALVALARFA